MSLKFSDKKQKKKLLAILQLLLCSVIAFPLEIADIVFMFTQKHFQSSVTGTQFYDQTRGEFAFQWISFILVTFVIFWSGWKFFKNAYFETFKWRRWGMSTLITLSVFVSYFFSFYPLIQNTVWFADIAKIGDNSLKSFLESNPELKTGLLSSFFPTSATVITIALIGQYIATTLKLKANEDLTSLSSLQVSEAYLKINNEIVKTKTNALKIGDTVVVYKNTLVPIDGQLISDFASLNEATITGESKPVLKQKEDKIIGSTTNVGETFEMLVTTNSKDTIVASIINNVRKIQAQKPKYQKIADKISFWFIPIVIVFAVLTFFLQGFIPNFDQALHNYTYVAKGQPEHLSSQAFINAVYSAVAILVVACPCALGLAVPLALVISSARAARNGVMINNAESYEKIKKINTIAFDKTGTLTKGEFEVSNFYANDEQLALLYLLEKKSLHPLAKSYKIFYENKFKDFAKLEDNDLIIEEVPGVGMKAIDAQKNEYLATSLKHAKTINASFDEPVQNFLNTLSVENALLSYVCLIKNNVVNSVVIFSDGLNENTIDTIELLKKLGIKVCLISGDTQQATSHIAKMIGIDEYYAEISPNQKAEIVAKLQENNNVVAFVGDGINDISALKQSDLSIAFNQENAIANSIADVSVLNKNIYSVYKILKIVQNTRKTILLNLFWSFIYNVILIPLTVLGYVPPYIAAFAMMFSEIVIVTMTIIFKNMKIRIIPKNIYEKIKNKETIQDRI